ncbi:MAG: hypothetical protein QXS54_04335 [Candidatus Methanomethylicaceae archaeon]
MMSQKKKKVVIKHLTPELLDDDALNHADWIAQLHKVVVSSGGIAAVAGDAHCLVHDLEHHRWYHYQLPKEWWSSWALAQDSTRLWGLVGNGKLTRLDLRSGEWIAFQHHTGYKSILYAEENAVIAQCEDILAIDVLRLENDSLQRIVRIPLKFDFIPSRISSAFFPEENQFIVLGGDMSGRRALWRLNWNGESDLILDVEGIDASLRFPFFVVLDEKKSLIYADLRENPVKPRYVNLDLCLKHGKPGLSADWRLHSASAFVFDNSLIVVLRLEYPYGQSAIIRLGKGKEPEIEAKKFDGISSKSCLLGRFLILGGEWVYDLVAHQEVRGLPWSTLLRQAIQDEVERQQAAGATITPMLTQAQERSDIDALKVFLRTSQYRLAEIEGDSIKNAISSSRHSAIFFLPKVPRVHWLPRGTDQLRLLLPEVEFKYGWAGFTFDEQDRIWACDLYGEYIAVVHLDQQEGQGQGFVVPHRFSLPVQAIAACDNTVAVASSRELAVYHYDQAEGLLKEMLCWRSKNDISGIKPDIEERGLWVVTFIRSSHRYVLKYLHLNGKVSAPRKVEEINHPIRIFGDWPERVYFAYTDPIEHVLHYTLNPKKSWHQVPLRNLVRKRSLYRYTGYPFPVSMSSDGDAIFVLVHVVYAHADNAYLLVRLRSGNAKLISAFERKHDSNSIQFVRWENWLVLYSDEPLVFAQAYANRAEITELPENKGTLFFHLPTNQFYAKPFTYTITDALRRMLSCSARGFLKSPL